MKAGEALDLLQRIEGSMESALTGLLDTVGVEGVPEEYLPQRTGLAPDDIDGALAGMVASGAAWEVEGRIVGGGTWDDVQEALRKRLDDFHADHPLRRGLAQEELRQVVQGSA